MTFDYSKIKDILVCPRSKCDLVLEGDNLVSTSPEYRLQFPIVEDIPRLLAEEAKQLSAEEWAEVMRRAGRDPQTGRLIT